MRVLFTPLALRAHIQAQATTAWALRAAGHDVCVAVRPDAIDEVARVGLTGVAVGPPMAHDAFVDEVVEDRAETSGASAALAGHDESLAEYDHLLGLMFGFSRFWFPQTCCERTIEEMVELARWWQPDLVVWDPCCPGGAVAARACGAAHARLLFGGDRFGRVREWFLRRSLERPPHDRPDPYRDWLAPHLDRIGQDFAEDIAVGQFTVNPMPAWVRRAGGVHYVQVRPVTHDGSIPAPAWLRERSDRPRVVVSLGLSHANLRGEQTVYAELLDAVADLDADIVATVHPQDLAAGTTIPENVRAAGHVPFSMLLPGCAAVVHHAGAGSFTTALLNAVPQILVPSLRIPEEHHWGAADFALGLTERGAGAAVWTAPVSGPVTEALTAVLADPGYARNAERLRDEALTTPTLSEVVPTLARLVDHHRRPRQE